jgi:multicomponent Na+:H+ antiporter subunit G
MSEWIRFIIVALCFGAGLFALFISLFGTFRFNYTINRLHSSAITDAIVLLLFTVGCVIASGANITSVKILIVLFIQWCTCPLVSHMFVKAKIKTDKNFKHHCKLPDCNNSTDKEES